MYSYIKGQVVELGENLLVLEAGNTGIGYELTVSMSTLSALKCGSIAKIFTYLVVREDEMSLFGFIDKAEKEIFLKLINISGVGPKMAITILSGVDYKRLGQIVMSGDVKALSTVKGVGKKTAERIILEMKGGLSLSDISVVEVGNKVVEDTAVADSIEILTSLGLGRSDVYSLVLEYRSQTDNAGEIVRLVLKRFGR